MTGTNPIVNTPPPPTPTAPVGINELGPDAFITLLTAQLQAQDPLNPMDPNQMVTELTSMNTLQETIQIRQDLDSLAAAAKASGSGTAGTGTSGTGTPAKPSPAPASSAATQAGATTPTPPVAAGAISSGLAALVHSLAPAAASTRAPLSNSKSQLF